MSGSARHGHATFTPGQFPVVSGGEGDGQHEAVVTPFPVDAAQRKVGQAALERHEDTPEPDQAILERYGVEDVAEAEELLEQNPLARLVLAHKNAELAAARAAANHQAALVADREQVIETMGRDPTTGAINREGWERYLSSRYGISHANVEHVEPHRAEHKPTRVVVGVVDVCDLKVVNDKFGHDKGDAMLREAVVTMNDLLREGDPIVRFGGDEFAFVIEVPADWSGHHIEAFKQELLSRFRERLAQKRDIALADMDANEQPEPIVALGLSSGLMVDYNTYNDMKSRNTDVGVTTYHLLLHDADEAMYTEKDSLKAQGISLPRGGVTPGVATEDPSLTQTERERMAAHDQLMKNIGRVYHLPTKARHTHALKRYKQHSAA